MGRASVDIIKSNAFKISALEVEGVLLRHPAVQARARADRAAAAAARGRPLLAGR
jgi:acyl-coenzyme A synthetase/AMP-(fatty) acid ligase